MSQRIVRSRESQSDIESIARHIAKDNVFAAQNLLREFDSTLDQIADFPGIGTRRPEFRKDICSLPVGNYVIFYQATTDGIFVVRILHGARDLRQQFRT